MTTYARIEGGLVMELFTTEGDITQLFSPALVWVDVGAAPVAVGWSYAGGVFAAPVPAVPPIPQQVDMRQAQLAMLEFTYPDGSNLLDKVNTLIAQQPRAAQVTWNTSGAVQRSNPLIAALQPALGLTDAQIDQLFVTAATL